VAAISAVFTIGYVANLLGEDEDWLFNLSTDMFPQGGCLWVYGVGEDGVPAFTQDGIDNLRQIIADKRAAGKAPPPQVPQKIAYPADFTACLPDAPHPSRSNGGSGMPIVNAIGTCECHASSGHRTRVSPGPPGQLPPAIPTDRYYRDRDIRNERSGTAVLNASLGVNPR
jgi:hypothetical protein